MYMYMCIIYIVVNSCTCGGSEDTPTALALMSDLHVCLLFLATTLVRQPPNLPDWFQCPCRPFPLRRFVHAHREGSGHSRIPSVIVMKMLHVLTETSTQVHVHECGILSVHIIISLYTERGLGSDHSYSGTYIWCPTRVSESRS